MTLQEAYYNDFDKEIKNNLNSLVSSGMVAFSKFYSQNKEFFKNGVADTGLLTKLLGFSINKLLFEAAFLPSAQYRAETKIVNGYHLPILHIYTDNFLLTPSHTYKIKELPSSCKYKKEYAKANKDGDGQLSLDFIKQEIIEPPYFGFVTYGYDYKTFSGTHTNLLIPDHNLKAFIINEPLKISSNLMSVSNAIDIEPAIVSINEEFEQIIKLKTEKLGE